MRIVGGSLKGRRIKVPNKGDIRPTAEKIREAIFSVLGDDILDVFVMDLFCGSGALGIEAISRGAAGAVFIDSSKASISALRQNIESMGLKEKTEVKLMKALSLKPDNLKNIAILFADPPYRQGYPDKLITLLSLQYFNWYGILALEHESDWSYKGIDPVILRRLDFGDTAVSFLRWVKEEI